MCKSCSCLVSTAEMRLKRSGASNRSAACNARDPGKPHRQAQITGSGPVVPQLKFCPPLSDDVRRDWPVPHAVASSELALHSGPPIPGWNRALKRLVRSCDWLGTHLPSACEQRRTYVFGEVPLAALALLTFIVLSGPCSSGVVMAKLSGRRHGAE